MYTVWSIVRLLSRPYDLTATGYKYLEIGINIWSIELCGDRPGKSSRTRTVAISRTWKGLYEQQ